MCFFDIMEMIARIFQREFEDIGGFASSGRWISLPESSVRYIGLYISKFIPTLSRFMAYIKQRMLPNATKSQKTLDDDTRDAIKEIFNLQRVISEIIIRLYRLKKLTAKTKMNATESAST